MVQMFGFHVWLERFRSLSVSLLLTDNGRERAPSGCQTLKLVCTKAETRGALGRAAALAGVFKRLILAMSWLQKRVENYMRLWPESKLRRRRPRPARPHVCARPKREREREERRGKKKGRGAKWVTSAVQPVCPRTE